MALARTQLNPPGDQKCRFFKLPAEIRLEIYDLALISRSRARIRAGGEPALLSVCKLIREEAIQAHYVNLRRSVKRASKEFMRSLSKYENAMGRPDVHIAVKRQCYHYMVRRQDEQYQIQRKFWKLRAKLLRKGFQVGKW